MTTPLETANRAIEEASPALWAVFSPLGRRVIFPPDIPFQAAQARGTTFNATIGQITDGGGGAVTLPPMAEAVALAGDDFNRFFLYSPIDGIAEVRERWRVWQRRWAPETVPSTLPIVSAGLTHGLSIAADLFAGEGRTVVVPSPFWGNYRQIFAVRHGARIVGVPGHDNGRYLPEAIAGGLAALPAGEPAVAILNIPSNPGGYSPTVAERRALAASLVAAAERRPLVVLCDDAYAGLVFDPEVPRGSMFWELAGLHPNLLPVKIDGATKEFSFFGGRVGFVTFPFAADSAIATALESKVKGLVRAGVGSPVAAGQVILLAALRREGIEREVEAVRLLLEERWRALLEALAQADPSYLRPLPCNSGCFGLVEIPAELGIAAEEVRQYLLAEEDTGVVAISPNYLRLAFCSMRADQIPELVRRVERGVAALAARIRA